MARIHSLSPVSCSRLMLFPLLSLLLFPLMACGSGPSDAFRSAPPSDPACRASATSPNDIDHRYLSSIAMPRHTTCSDTPEGHTWADLLPQRPSRLDVSLRHFWGHLPG